MADSIQITLPDGSSKAAPAGIRVGDFVKDSIGAGLAKAAVLASFNGKEVDLTRQLTETGSWRSSPRRPPRRWRSSATTPRTSWPARCSGSSPAPRSPSARRSRTASTTTSSATSPSRPRTSSRSRTRPNEEIAKDLPFVREEVSIDDAIKLFEGKGEKFKVEIVKDIVAKGAKTLTLYSHGDWVDFCLGPHGPSTGEDRRHQAPRASAARTGAAITETRCCSASTAPRSSTRRSSTRSSSSSEEAEEARPPQARPRARPVPLPPGRAGRRVLDARRAPRSTRCCRRACASSRRENGYEEIKTPLLYNKALWEMCGHWGKYKENMFLVLDSETTRRRDDVTPRSR